ncbi:MAG: hypothetical protein JWO33_975 [Caulobacteraceae bacterium]|nr:hypothetical protein [Caulobacteraceae bacterium]
MDAWPQEVIRERDAVLFEGRPRVSFTVVAVHEDKCWIQDHEGREAIVELSRCIRARTFH